MEITKFLGVETTSLPEKLPPGDLEQAYDVDIDGFGSIGTRTGLTSVVSGAAHSVFAKGDVCLFAQGNVLKRLQVDGTVLTLATLTSAERIAYVEVAGVIYFSNGVDTGRVVGGTVRRWGIAHPAGQPRAAAMPGAGALPAGTYLYTVTFGRSDGQESGSPVPGQVTLTEAGGIAFSSFPTTTDPDVTLYHLYLSGPDGKEQFHVGFFPVAGATYQFLNSPPSLGRPLHMDGLVEAAPPGTDLEYHAGVLYVVDGSVVWHSDPYSPEQFQRGTNFLQFPGPINLFRAVDDGIYVATDDAAWFLDGRDPGKLESRRALDVAGAVPGTGIRVDASAFDNSDDSRQTQATEVAVMWLSKDGVIRGRKGGTVDKMTTENYTFPRQVRGAAMARQMDGYVAYVVTGRS